MAPKKAPSNVSAKNPHRGKRTEDTSSDISDVDSVQSISDIINVLEETTPSRGPVRRPAAKQSKPEPKAKTAPSSRKRPRPEDDLTDHTSAAVVGDSAVNVDSNTDTAETTANASTTTLSVEKLPVTTAKTRTRSTSKQPTDAASHTCEIKPTKPSKKTTLTPVIPPSEAARERMAEEYLKEVVVPGMIARSLLSAESAVRVTVTAQGHVEEQTESNSQATTEVAANADAHEAETEDTPDVEDSTNTEEKQWQVQVRAALPCVSDFVFRECHAAGVRAQEDAPDSETAGVVGSLRMLGFFFDLVRFNKCGTLLYLACPSCRVYGVPRHGMAELAQFLLASQRCTADRVAQMEMPELLASLDAPAETAATCQTTGASDVPARPTPTRWCTCAETHMALMPLLNPAIFATPLRVQTDWMLPESLMPYKELAETLYRRHKQETQVKTRIAQNRFYAEKYGRPITVPGVKPLSARQLRNQAEWEAKEEALLRSLNPMWAKEKLARLHGGSENVEKAKDLVAQIKSATTHVLKSPQETATVGCHFRFTITMKPNQPFISNRSSTINNPFSLQTHVQSAVWLFLATSLIARSATGPHPDEESVTAKVKGSAAKKHLAPSSLGAPASGRLFLLEELESATHAWRREREETQLVVPKSAVDMITAASTTTEPKEHMKNAYESGYAAGSHVLSRVLYEECFNLGVPGLIRYAANQGTLGLLDNDCDETVESLAPPHLIRGTLKRHQLENVAWMLNREQSPVAEMVEIPIYSPDYAVTPHPAVQVGSFFYCATTCEYHLMRAQNATNRSLFRPLRAAIRGGFLSDDVGLGKTLSILSLCAADSVAMNSSTVCAPSHPQHITDDEAPEDDGDVVSEDAPPRQWTLKPQVGIVAVERPLVKAAASMTSQYLTHLLPGALSEAAWKPRHRLGQTTLIVVPLSIVGQWIEEIERFYPTATYVLFHGTKRTQFTIEDFTRADFVITTYETLTVHLRKECDATNQLMTEWVREADGRMCSAAVSQHQWKQCRPSFLFDAAAQYATAHVWPTATPPAAGQDGAVTDFFNSVTLRGHGGIRQPPDLPGAGVATSAPAQKDTRKRKRADNLEADGTPRPPVTTTWSMDVACGDHLAVLRGPGDLVFEVEPLVQTVAGGAEAVLRARARKKALSAPLLDAVWEQFRVVSKCYPYVPLWPWVPGNVEQFPNEWRQTFADVNTVCVNRYILYLLKLAELYPPPLDVQRAITAYVLLPSCAKSAASYFTGMKEHHYAEERKTEEEGHAPIHVLDILFRRVVLDECQKCGSNGLFFLLAGERRWAVSGTPINNNNPQTMSGPLRFIGAGSASRYLRRYSSPNDCTAAPYTHDGDMFVNCVENAALTQMAAEGQSVDAMVALLRASDTARQQHPPAMAERRTCLCRACTLKALFPAVDWDNGDDDLTWLPADANPRLLVSEHRQRMPRFFCHTLVAILCRFVVRHERDEQMRRELALVSVQHKEVPARLSVAERGLYDPAARAVSVLAQRWARQGLFGNHAGRAQQWLQNLQRLAFHPALQLREPDPARAAQAANQRPPPRAAQAATLADLIVRRVALEVVTEPAAADPATEEELQKALLSSFITMSAPEAVTWAESETLLLRMGLPAAAGVRGQRAPAASSGNKPHQVFPQETMEMLKKIAEIPPELPTCGVCMDIMAEPTVMTCYHLFCKQCIIDIVDSSRNTMTRNIHAKCPYCRDTNAMINEKRVVQPQFHAEGASQAQLDLEDAVAEMTNPAADAEAEVNSVPVGTPDEQLAARLSAVGVGTRVEALLQLLERQVWSAAQPQSDDGVLIFSKFPAALERVRHALTERGYKPHLITGGVTLAQRRKIIAGLCHTRTEDDASSTATASAEREQTARGDRRILLLTSRAANAGLNLTFANHVVFMEPNVNPALEIQAIGRAQRFGQTKQVYAYHLYAPDTVEDRIYTQSRQVLAAAERERPQQQEQREGHLHNAPMAAINQMRPQDLLYLLTIPRQ